MAENIQPAPMPRSFMADMPNATMNAGLALLSRRTTALADFWRSCAEVRQPTELMAVQLNYWTQLVDDYQELLSQSLSQIAGAAGEPPAAAQPPSAAHSA
jgi:hypothetical protein